MPNISLGIYGELYSKILAIELDQNINRPRDRFNIGFRVGLFFLLDNKNIDQEE